MRVLIYDRYEAERYPGAEIVLSGGNYNIGGTHASIKACTHACMHACADAHARSHV